MKLTLVAFAILLGLVFLLTDRSSADKEMKKKSKGYGGGGYGDGVGRYRDDRKSNKRGYDGDDDYRPRKSHRRKPRYEDRFEYEDHLYKTKNKIDDYLAKKYLLGKRRLQFQLKFLNTPLEYEYYGNYHGLQHPLTYTKLAPTFGFPYKPAVNQHTSPATGDYNVMTPPFVAPASTPHYGESAEKPTFGPMPPYLPQATPMTYGMTPMYPLMPNGMMTPSRIMYRAPAPMEYGHMMHRSNVHPHTQSATQAPVLPAYPFVNPVHPSAPTDHAYPATPIVNPVYPATPPVNPVYPALSPVNPAYPATPPVNPAYPATPPVNPAYPATPPVNPAYPATPPVNPAFAATSPVNPAYPDQEKAPAGLTPEVTTAPTAPVQENPYPGQDFGYATGVDYMDPHFMQGGYAHPHPHPHPHYPAPEVQYPVNQASGDEGQDHS